MSYISTHHNLPCDRDSEEIILRRMLNKANCPSLLSDADFRLFTERIGRRDINTWKRVFGHLQHQGNFSQTTLNIIAQYLGNNHWEELLESVKNEDGTPQQTPAAYMEYSVIMETDADINLPRGQRIEIQYANCKTLQLESLGSQKYNVLATESRQLQCHDLLLIEHLQVGYPLLGTIIRNQHRRGQYNSTSNIERISDLPSNPNYD